MYCSRCGKIIEDGEKFCSGCGQPVVQTADPYATQSTTYAGNQTVTTQFGGQNQNTMVIEERASFWWFVLGLVMPLAGFIMYFVYRRQFPNRAKKLLYGGIAGAIFGVISYYSGALDSLEKSADNAGA